MTHDPLRIDKAGQRSHCPQRSPVVPLTAHELVQPHIPVEQWQSVPEYSDRHTAPLFRNPRGKQSHPANRKFVERTTRPRECHKSNQKFKKLGMTGVLRPPAYGRPVCACVGIPSVAATTPIVHHSRLTDPAFGASVSPTSPPSPKLRRVVELLNRFIVSGRLENWEQWPKTRIQQRMGRPNIEIQRFQMHSKMEFRIIVERRTVIGVTAVL
jgi:hypothetical protein